MARFTFKVWKETRLRHCTQCAKRITPCSTICPAFSDRTEDQIHRTTQEQQAYRTALREATDAHLSRCQCQRTDCPRTV